MTGDETDNGAPTRRPTTAERDDVPDEIVREAAASVLAGTAAGASA